MEIKFRDRQLYKNYWINYEDNTLTRYKTNKLSLIYFRKMDI